MSDATQEIRTCAEDGCETTVEGFSLLCPDCRHVVKERREEIRRWTDRKIEESGIDVSPSQRRTIQRITHAGWQEAAGLELQYYRKHEVKDFTIEEHERFLTVRMKLGRKGDEGTAAAAFCRPRQQFFVGPRGGLTYYVPSRNGDGRAKMKGTRRLYRAFRS